MLHLCYKNTVCVTLVLYSVIIVFFLLIVVSNDIGQYLKYMLI